MKWDGDLNPFRQVKDICFNEIGCRVEGDIKLIDFGVDSRKLYFQFSFFTKSKLTFQEIQNSYSQNEKETGNPRRDIKSMSLDKVDAAINNIVSNCWEPAAEASLLTLLAIKFDKDTVKQGLFSRKSYWAKRSMVDEWDYRASKSGLLPVMSVRYSQDKLSELSDSYEEEFIFFIGSDIENMNVVEIGSGIGRITQHLSPKAEKVTCVELCEKMISRSMERLGHLDNVNYVNIFAQDYHIYPKYDLTVCSLVLMHNTDESEYEKLIESMCSISDVIFIAEDITVNRKTSPFTKLRPEHEICEKFRIHGFYKERCKLFILDSDDIISAIPVCVKICINREFYENAFVNIWTIFTKFTRS